MPYLYISQDDSTQPQLVSIPHSIPPQTISLVGYSVTFHKADHSLVANPYNSVIFVNMPWVKNRNILCSRNDNDTDELGHPTNKDFASGVIPLLLDFTLGGMQTFVPSCHGLNIDLMASIPQSFTVDVYHKDIHNNYVPYDGMTAPGGAFTAGYCKVKMIFSYMSGASY